MERDTKMLSTVGKEVGEEEERNKNHFEKQLEVNARGVFFGVHSFKQEDVNELIEALKNNKRKNKLKKFSLCFTQLSRKENKKLFEGLLIHAPSLKNLVFSWCDLNAEGGMEEISLFLSKQKQQRLRRGRRGLQQQKPPQLTSLSLDGTQLTAQNAVQLSKALQQQTRLKRLFLVHNEIGVLGLDAVTKQLISHNTITKLDVSNNKLPGECVGSIVELMKRTTSLTDLQLNNNFGGDGTTNAFATTSILQEMEKQQTILRLGLTGTVDTLPATPLVNMLLINTHLRSLSLLQTFLTSADWKMLCLSFQKNNTLRTEDTNVLS